MTWLPRVRHLLDEARAHAPGQSAALLSRAARLGRRPTADRLLARAFEGGWSNAVLAAHHDVRRDEAQRLDAELCALEEQFPYEPDKVVAGQLEAVSRSLRDQDRVFRTAHQLLMPDLPRSSAGPTDGPVRSAEG